jgi:hypothetical protein
MGRIEKTLPRISRLGNPGGMLWSCYRHFDSDMAVCWMGTFPAPVMPDRIRVIVEWDDEVAKTSDSTG